MTNVIRWIAPAALIASVSPPCIAAQYMSVEQAKALIFAQAKEFVSTVITLTPAQIERIEQQAGVKVSSVRPQVWQARIAETLLGWFIVDQVVGKHDLITYALGINANGSIRQVQVIEYREAYGYQVSHLKWRDQFVGKTIADSLNLDADIVNISGATLSCRHLTEGIRCLLAFHNVALL